MINDFLGTTTIPTCSSDADCTQKIEQMCNTFATDGMYWESRDLYSQVRYIVWSFISSFGFMFLALTIAYNKELQVHPMKLI